MQLWTAGSQRGAFAAWRALLRERRAAVGRLAASAAANTRSSSFKVLLADWSTRVWVDAVGDTALSLVEPCREE
jgi:hypothetical protein